MALPQQVVEQLSRGSQRTPGWSSGILLFSGSILFIIVFVYAGLKFGYEPYLNAQLSSLESQTQKIGQSVSPSDQDSLITFYSQISNIESLIKNHIFFSQFLTWLERSTEANVYYTGMVFTSGNQITLTGIAKTSADVTEQVAVFQSAPEVSSVALSNITLSPSTNNWAFSVVLTMQPSLFLWVPGSSSPSAVIAPAPAGASSSTPTSTPPAAVMPTTATTTTP